MASEEEMNTFDCAACQRTIDENAKLCPFCGSDPRTGEKVDTTPILQETFPPRRDLPVHERLLDFFRQRQSIILTAVILSLFLALFGLHRFVTARAESAASDVPAITLAEIADISSRTDKQQPLPLPELEFSYGGSPKAMRTFMVEPGAVAPQAPVVANTPPVVQQQPGTPAGATPPQPAGPVRVPPAGSPPTP